MRNKIRFSKLWVFFHAHHYIIFCHISASRLAGKAFSGMTNGQCMHEASKLRSGLSLGFDATVATTVACHRCLFFSLNRKDRESSAPQVTRQLKIQKRQLENTQMYSQKYIKFGSVHSDFKSRVLRKI